MQLSIRPLFVLALLLGSAKLFAQTEPADTAAENAPKPKVEWESKVFEFGEVTQGERVTHTFYFTNVGEADLQITSVKASCGCTTPNWSREPVAPGEKGQIDVIFNTRGKMGNQYKNVTIRSNADPAIDHVALKGVVTKPAPAPEGKPDPQVEPAQ